MKTDIKKLQNSEIEITGEIEAGDFEAERKEAVKCLGEHAKIDGFRPGNVPEKILIEKIGEQALLEDMAEHAIRKAYQKILEENKIHAIGRPEIIITKIARNNPLGFKIKTAIMPEIELGDYKKIAEEIMAKEEKISVEEKEVEQTLDYLRKMRSAPEVNDDFAKTLGKFENLNQLKDVLRKNINEEKLMKAKEKKRLLAIEKIIEASNIDIPKILIEAEKDKIQEEMKTQTEQMGLKWEDYLAQTKKNEDDLRKERENDAVKRVSAGLIINQIAEKEKIEVPKDDWELETQKILEYYKNIGENIDEDRVRSYTYGILRNEKVFQFLESC